MYKIASHNSFTCYEPKGLFSKIFKFAGRCQRVSIYEQYYKYGVRLFDLRIYPTGLDTFNVCHGSINFDSKDLSRDLTYLNSKKDVTLRILLEQNFAKSEFEQRKIELEFRTIIERLKNKYSFIKFIGGRRKYDWKVIYDFNTIEPTIADMYSSTTNLINPKMGNNHWTAKIDDLWPWLYAVLNNKKNLIKEYDQEYLMIDFIDIPKRY